MNRPALAALPFCASLIAGDRLEELVQALDQAGLPSGGLGLPNRRFRFADASGLIGLGGLEGMPPDLLLRSVIVRPDRRGCGNGGDIVGALERHAAENGGVTLHLLTTTATAFFVRLGYQPASRAAAPVSIAALQQFASICPANASYLVKTLAGA